MMRNGLVGCYNDESPSKSMSALKSVSLEDNVVCNIPTARLLINICVFAIRYVLAIT